MASLSKMILALISALMVINVHSQFIDFNTLNTNDRDSLIRLIEDGNLTSAFLNTCNTATICEINEDCVFQNYMSYCACSDGFVNITGTNCSEINECGSSDVNLVNVTNAAGGLNQGVVADPTSPLWNASVNGVYTFYSNSTHTCSATQACGNTVGGFDCACLDGYEGSNCTDIDECLKSPCGENANCTNNAGSYSCSCFDGFYLAPDSKTCYDVNECGTGDAYLIDIANSSMVGLMQGTVVNSSYSIWSNTLNGTLIFFSNQTHNCSSPWTCGNTPGGFECLCMKGYEGDNCADIDECDQNICGVNATCNNINGSYNCDCSEGSYKPNGWASCTDNCSVSCAAYSSCTVENDTLQECSCMEGYFGDGSNYCINETKTTNAFSLYGTTWVQRRITFISLNYTTDHSYFITDITEVISRTNSNNDLKMFLEIMISFVENLAKIKPGTWYVSFVSIANASEGVVIDVQIMSNDTNCTSVDVDAAFKKLNTTVVTNDLNECTWRTDTCSSDQACINTPDYYNCIDKAAYCSSVSKYVVTMEIKNVPATSNREVYCNGVIYAVGDEFWEALMGVCYAAVEVTQIFNETGAAYVCHPNSSTAAFTELLNLTFTATLRIEHDRIWSLAEIQNASHDISVDFMVKSNMNSLYKYNIAQPSVADFNECDNGVQCHNNSFCNNWNGSYNCECNKQPITYHNEANDLCLQAVGLSCGIHSISFKILKSFTEANQIDYTGIHFGNGSYANISECNNIKLFNESGSFYYILTTPSDYITCGAIVEEFGLNNFRVSIDITNNPFPGILAYPSLNKTVTCNLTQSQLTISIPENTTNKTTPSKVDFNLGGMAETFSIQVEVFTDPDFVNKFNSSKRLTKNSFLYFKVSLNTSGTSFFVIIRDFWATTVPSVLASREIVLVENYCQKNYLAKLLVQGTGTDAKMRLQMFGTPDSKLFYLFMVVDVLTKRSSQDTCKTRRKREIAVEDVAITINLQLPNSFNVEADESISSPIVKQNPEITTKNTDKLLTWTTANSQQSNASKVSDADKIFPAFIKTYWYVIVLGVVGIAIVLGAAICIIMKCSSYKSESYSEDNMTTLDVMKMHMSSMKNPDALF